MVSLQRPGLCTSPLHLGRAVQENLAWDNLLPHTHAYLHICTHIYTCTSNTYAHTHMQKGEVGVLTQPSSCTCAVRTHTARTLGTRARVNNLVGVQAMNT